MITLSTVFSATRNAVLICQIESIFAVLTKVLRVQKALLAIFDLTGFACVRGFIEEVPSFTGIACIDGFGTGFTAFVNAWLTFSSLFRNP